MTGAGCEVVSFLQFQKPLWTFFSPLNVQSFLVQRLHPKINAQKESKEGQSGACGSFSAVARVRINNVMTFDHPVQRFPVDREDAGSCLLVSTGINEYAGYVPSFDFR